MEIVERLLEGDVRAAARLISMIEDDDPRAAKALSLLHRHTGKAHVIGFTGPPGAGKSTVIDKVTGIYRAGGQRVGILAVDPTSPFTGGALLGDRIRMQRHSTDGGVFIRSMGTRGHMGGLAKGIWDAIKVLEAMGMNPVLVETVGTGQSEVEVVRGAHTVVVVVVPGLGDEIQAIKAGIFEIADIFVVNKADRGEAEQTIEMLRGMIEMGEQNRSWIPPVLGTVGRSGDGMQDLIDAIGRHLSYLKGSGMMECKDRQRTKDEFMDLLRERLTRYIMERSIERGGFDALVERILRRQIDPYSAAEEIISGIDRKC
ncbi:MAG: methylmalonyl Co-A mutase-associated GTPase MeaB [Candidatus Thermoplasmatota archaeon]